MMSLRLRHILAYSLALLLFVSTSGVPVHKMICLCKGEQVISWFSATESGCCQHTPVQPQLGCCTAEDSDHDSGKRNCQEQETTLARIYVQFLADKTIQASDGTLSSFFTVGATDFFLNTGFHLANAIHLSCIPFFSSGPPRYRMGCQIRC